MLYPPAIPRSLLQSAADLTTGEADIFQVPIAEMAQRDEVRLALTARDHGGDHAVDETAEAHQKNSGSSPDSWDGVAWGSVEHRHVFSLSTGPTLRTVSPSVGISMHGPAHQDFQRTAIYSPDAREMHLRYQIARNQARSESGRDDPSCGEATPRECVACGIGR